MGRTSQAKKRAKLKKLMAKPASEATSGQNTENKNSPKELIETAIQFFQNGDVENAKKIAKRVIKVYFTQFFGQFLDTIFRQILDNF